MKIGFDLHYTLASFRVDFWKLAAENIGMREIPEAPKAWGFPEYPHKLEEECKRLFKMNWYMNDLMYFDMHASYLVNTCSLCGHDMFIISASEKEVQEGARQRIKRAFGGMIREVSFEPSKGHEFSRFGLDVWVDDNPYDCHLAASRGIRTIMINRSWNQKLYSQDTAKLIKRVDGLDGVVKYLNILPGFRKPGV